MTAVSAAARRRNGAPTLLRAKLSRPNLGDHILDRPRLVRALADHATRPLMLIVAEAGFGKTTLLTAFARSVSRPVVWYSLMPSDADPAVFGRYLLEGFRRESPRFGRDFERALDETAPGRYSAEMLGGTFVNELASLKGPPHLLVLDDFQEVSGNPQVIAFMDAVLRHVPERVRILIASRSVPPLALERMRARGELFELDSTHLRLTRDELGHLFADVYRRPTESDEIQALEETTLGWPTAVHLVHESLRRVETVALKDVLDDFRASNLELHDYLSAEVYAHLDESSRLLLERTAPLERFDAELATTLSGLRPARSALDALGRRGLLRTFGTGFQATYECHDLVRRFVRHEIESREGPDAWKRCEADAAAALEGRGDAERALRHYLLAGRIDDAIRIARTLAPAMLKQGRAAALLQYLDDLPPETLARETPLLVATADAHRALGNWDRAELLYQEALDRARRDAAFEDECRIIHGLGRVLNFRGRHEQVLGMTERALAGPRAPGPELRARLLQMKAGTHFYLGQYEAAIRMLGEVRELLKQVPDQELVVPTVHNLAMAYAAQGRFREASDELRAALTQVRGTSSPRAPLYLSNLASLLAEQGELNDARHAAEEGLAAARRFSNRAQETTCQLALAQILAQCGDFDGALAALKRAEELNAELRMELIAADLLALRARIFCGRGEYRRAVEFLNEAIGRLASRPDDPRLIEYQGTLAWCELRAGRLHAARDLLVALRKRALADENDFRRMRVHYWLAEVMLALGEKRGVTAPLQLALKLVRERGYHYFLRVQAREEPAPLLEALAHEIETTTVAAALVEAGGSIEEPLLAMLEEAPTRVAEAVVAVLAEVGSRTAHDALERLARNRRGLKPAIRTALRHIGERAERGIAPDPEAPDRRARLVLFGPPQLQVDGQTVPASVWRAQRAFHMLVYLSLHPRGASKDDLLERFWPGRQAAAGRKNFHPTLSYIRSVLPPAPVAPILREAEFYRLNPAYPLTCDVWDFERALDEARAARASHDRRTALGRAAALAGAPFLQGLYADWADERQVRMRDRVERLLLDLGALCAEAGDYEAALEHFRRAAEFDAYRESTRLAVIECSIRIGNRRAALVEYEKLKTLLRTELDVDPLPETEEAVRQLFAGGSAKVWNGKADEEDDQVLEPQRTTASTQVHVKARTEGWSAT